MRRFQAVLPALILSLSISGTALAAVQAGAWGLPQLMQSLAQVKSGTANFTEHKTMHMLKAPLVETGTLDYVAPDHVRKITTSPVPEQFSLDGDVVTISGPGNGAGPQTRHFALSAYPQIGGLVAGIRATLAGDLATLDRYYSVQLSGVPEQWQLLLQPKSSTLTKYIKSIRIEGDGDRIGQIDTKSTDGDHSEMSVAETVHDAQ
jgi:outer membrane lipoprotein-sorting protein